MRSRGVFRSMAIAVASRVKPNAGRTRNRALNTSMKFSCSGVCTS